MARYLVTIDREAMEIEVEAEDEAEAGDIALEEVEGAVGVRYIDELD